MRKLKEQVPAEFRPIVEAIGNSVNDEAEAMVIFATTEGGKNIASLCGDGKGILKAIVPALLKSDEILSQLKVAIALAEKIKQDGTKPCPDCGEIHGNTWRDLLEQIIN